MTNYIENKSIIVTGAAGGFGKLLCIAAAAKGANVTLADINEQGLEEAAEEIHSAGHSAITQKADVSNIDDMRALARKAVEAFGRIDVMVNNAGIMPLAFYADHEKAMHKWHSCIDINFKGVLNGITSVYDQMMSQGEGHVVNISSIYGNFPVVGAGVYGATKSAVNFLSESLRVESHGKIKVTVIKPTGIPSTGITSAVVNDKAGIGILGQNISAYANQMKQMMSGEIDPTLLDPESIGYVMLDPAYISEQVLHAINQPKGVSLGDITIRATGDMFIL